MDLSCGRGGRLAKAWLPCRGFSASMHHFLTQNPARVYFEVDILAKSIHVHGEYVTQAFYRQLAQMCLNKKLTLDYRAEYS